MTSLFCLRFVCSTSIFAVLAATHSTPQQFHRNVSEAACAVARLAAERCLDDLLPISELHP